MNKRSVLHLVAWTGLACVGTLLFVAANTVPSPQTVAALERFFGKQLASNLPALPAQRLRLRETLEDADIISEAVDGLSTAAIPETEPDKLRTPRQADIDLLNVDLHATLDGGLESSGQAPLLQRSLAADTLVAIAQPLGELDYAVPIAPGPVAVRKSFQGILAEANALGHAGNGLSLPEALALANQDNPEINAARAELRALGETVPQAQASMRPNVFGTIDTGSVFSGARFDSSLNQADTVSFGLKATQKLFDGFQTRNNVAAARAQVAAARKNLANLEQNVTYSAATVYMDVLRDRQIAVLRRTNMKFLDEQVRAAEVRFDIGEATRTDMAQATSQRALAFALLSSALADVETSEALFERIIGTAPHELRPASVPKSKLPLTLSEAQRVAQLEHPSILANRYTADAAAALARSAQGALLPSINLTASLNDSFALNTAAPTGLASSVSDTRSRAEASIGVRLTIPLYQGGGASARERQAKEVMGQRRIEADGSRMKVRAAVATAWAQLKATEASITGFQARLAAARLALEGVIEEQSVGQRTTLDVLNANDQVVSGAILLLGAQRNLVVAGYSLISAVGRLSSEPAIHVGSIHPNSKLAVRRGSAADDWSNLRVSASQGKPHKK